MKNFIFFLLLECTTKTRCNVFKLIHGCTNKSNKYFNNNSNDNKARKHKIYKTNKRVEFMKETQLTLYSS